MYRSILELDMQSPSARRDLRWPYELYRTLKRCRASSGLDEEARILFCYEGESCVIVQSPLPLHFWDGMPSGYARSIRTSKMELPKTGDMLEFQLMANPIVKKSGSNYRMAIHGTNEQLAWLARQGASNGFAIVRSDVAGGHWGGIGQENTDKADLPVFRVTFEGVLIVTDAEQFTDGVKKGIGSGKMHGLGLLQYAPYNQ